MVSKRNIILMWIAVSSLTIGVFTVLESSFETFGGRMEAFIYLYNISPVLAVTGTFIFWGVIIFGATYSDIE